MTPLLSIVTDPVPLEADTDGVVRVGGTRVALDLVVGAFDQGATAEEIVQRFPSLRLPDVYAVIAYSLRHREEVDAYLAERRTQAGEVRRTNEGRWDPSGIRARLMARRSDRPPC